MSTEIFRKYPSNLSTLFIIGYILRIIPYIQIVGAVLTAVSWGMLNRKWINDQRLILPIIGSILVLAGHTMGVLIGVITAQGVNISTEPASTAEAVDALIQVVDAMINQLSSIYGMLSPILVGMGIMLEASGLYFLRRHIKEYMPVYVVLGLIVLSIIFLATPIAYMQTVEGLEEYKKILLDVKENLDKYDERQSQEIILTVLMEMLSAVMPLITTMLMSFVVSIIAYILVALRFHSFQKLRREAIILEEGTIRGEEEEILI